MALALSAGMFACGDSSNKEEGGPIGKADIKVEQGIMTPEVLHSFGRVSDIQVSPDQSKILYGVTYVSIEQNKTNRELFTMNINGSDKKQITKTPKSEGNAVWLKEGTQIAYLSSEGGSSQIWIINADGSGKKQLSNEDKDILGFSFSPDESKVLVIKNIDYNESIEPKHKDLPKASGRVVTDLMYKHWDSWIEEIPHTYIADFDGNSVSNLVDIIEGEPYELPILPFGGLEQLSWSPDGKTIAYSCKKMKGEAYALSTNTDIYLYDIANKTSKNITEGMMGYDTTPLFSHDGSKLAWLSMERDGYEADKNRLFVMDMASGEKNYITEAFDYNIDNMIWAKDNNSIYAVSCVEAKTHLFSINLENKEIKAITKGDYDYESCFVAGDDKLIAMRHSMSKPNEIYSVNIADGEATELSFENKHILDQLTMGKVEERWITTTDNKKMLTWIVYPPNFDPNKKYPTLLYCQGGPQSTVSQFWSYRWNPQIMAANDYIIVAPNRRGLPGFGQEWLEQISKDYGGQNMKDYLSAIDEMAKEPFVDADRLGCTGASYGGFSVFWLAGNHNKRFKAFFAQAGIFKTVNYISFIISSYK